MASSRLSVPRNASSDGVGLDTGGGGGACDVLSSSSISTRAEVTELAELRTELACVGSWRGRAIEASDVVWLQHVTLVLLPMLLIHEKALPEARIDGVVMLSAGGAFSLFCTLGAAPSEPRTLRIHASYETPAWPSKHGSSLSPRMTRLTTF